MNYVNYGYSRLLRSLLAAQANDLTGIFPSYQYFPSYGDQSHYLYSGVLLLYNIHLKKKKKVNLY